MRELGLVSAMVVPLGPAAARSARSPWSPPSPDGTSTRRDLELAEDLARRAALAIDNSMLFHREHEAALTLQRSLLPPRCPRSGRPSSPRATSLRHRASRSVATGTRWSRTTTARSRVTIGDVAGRGIRAAVVMGRVRPALRAFALDGRGAGGDDRAASTR